jgi:hypothetical protein
MKLIDRIDLIARKFERFVGGSAVNDPLYLTNRTIGHKIRLGVLIGTPVLALGVLMYMALDSQFDRPALRERAAAIESKKNNTQPTGEITSKVLPNLEKSIISEQSKDVDVVEAAVSHAGEPTLSGKVRNNTENMVRVADVVFDITDQGGSQVGGVSVRVENIKPKSVATFRVSLPQKDARAALVREVHSR